MQDKSSDECQGDGDEPHTDDETVHVKYGIAASVQHSVYGDCIHTASDHINGHDHHHSCKVFPGLVGEDDHFYHQRSHCQHQSGGQKADDIGHILELYAVCLT